MTMTHTPHYLPKLPPDAQYLGKGKNLKRAGRCEEWSGWWYSETLGEWIYQSDIKWISADTHYGCFDGDPIADELRPEPVDVTSVEELTAEAARLRSENEALLHEIDRLERSAGTAWFKVKVLQEKLDTILATLRDTLKENEND